MTLVFRRQQKFLLLALALLTLAVVSLLLVSGVAHIDPGHVFSLTRHLLSWTFGHATTWMHGGHMVAWGYGKTTAWQFGHIQYNHAAAWSYSHVLALQYGKSIAYIYGH